MGCERVPQRSRSSRGSSRRGTRQLAEPAACESDVQLQLRNAPVLIRHLGLQVANHLLQGLHLEMQLWDSRVTCRARLPGVDLEISAARLAAAGRLCESCGLAALTRIMRLALCRVVAVFRSETRQERPGSDPRDEVNEPVPKAELPRSSVAMPTQRSEHSLPRVQTHQSPREICANQNENVLATQPCCYSELATGLVLLQLLLL